MIGQSQKDPLPQKRIPGQVPDHPVSDQPATVLEMDDCRLGVFAKHPVHHHSIAELQQCGLELAHPIPAVPNAQNRARFIQPFKCPYSLLPASDSVSGHPARLSRRSLRA